MTDRQVEIIAGTILAVVGTAVVVYTNHSEVGYILFFFGFASIL